MLNFDIKINFGAIGGENPDTELLVIEGRIVRGLQDIIRRSGPRVKEEADRDAQKPKTGKQYPGLPNRSSAPGESPAKQSGKLLDSIETVYSVDGLSQTTGPKVDYAVYLNSGLGGAQNARPVMKGAFDVVTKDVVHEIIDLMRGR